jgi:uncharacterized protein
MITISTHPEGSILPVRAQPRASKTRVLGEQGGALKIAITAPAEDGRANEALTDALRKLLRLKRSQLELTSGQTTRNKRFLIRGLRPGELEKRLILARASC